MSKSKFQSEKDKQESILNCISSITGNLSEAVISGFNPSISNKRKSQQSPSFNPTASSPTFNPTASSPTFNPTASSPTFKNQNGSAAPKKQNDDDNDDGIVRGTGKIINNMARGLESTANSIGSGIESTANSIRNRIEPTFNNMARGLESTANSIGSGIESTANSIRNRIEPTFNNMARGTEAGYNWISDKVSSFTNPAPSFNQTASSPTFNQTASSPKFNSTAAPSINQNPPSVQDVWNRLLLPKKEKPVAAAQPNIETDKNRGLGSSPDINAVSKSINNKNKSDNSVKVPFTPDFSGDAPPNIDLSSGGNKTQPVASAVTDPRKPNLTMRPAVPAVPAVAPMYQPDEAQHQDMFAGTLQGRPETDKQNFLGTPDTTKPPELARLGYGASVRTPNASSPVNPTQKTKDDFNKYFKKPSSDIRPGSPADAAAKILDKQNTVGTPDTSGASIAPVATQPAKKQSSRYSRADTIGNNLYGNVEVNGKEVDTPFNNPRTVPFTPDFSGDAPPNINLSSGGNKTQPVAASNSVRLNDPYSQEIVTTEMDKANQTSAVPTTASLGYGASVRTPPAASTSKNSQMPMRGDEDQGTSETNQMITYNYPDQAQHQDMFAGSGRPADTDRRPESVENVAAGIVNKQDTIGTPDTTGTTVFGSKTGDFRAKPQNNNPQTNPGFMTSPQGAPTVFGSKTGDFRAKPQNNNPQTNPGFMTSPQGGPNTPSTSVPKPKTSAAPATTPARVSTPSSKQPIKAPPKDEIEAPPFEAPRGSDRGNTKPDKFGNSPAVVQKYNKDSAAWELTHPNHPAVIFKKQQDALDQADKEKKTREDAKPDYDPNEINRFNSQLARDRQQGVLRPGENYKGTPGVGSLEDSRRGRVGLDALGDQDRFKSNETPEEAIKRYKAIRMQYEKEGYKFTKAYTEDNALGGMLSRDESAAVQADENESAEALKKDSSATATTRNRTKYLADRKASSDLYNSDEEKIKRAKNRDNKETADHEKNLLRLQRRTDLTNARNALEDAQNRKTSSGWNMSSASRGGGGGGAGQPAATNNKTAFDSAADQMSKEISNTKQAEWDKKYDQRSGQAPLETASRRSEKTMKNGTLIAELFDGDFLSDLKDAAAAVGTLATPPEELLYTTGGVMGRSGYTRQGASKRTRHYQDILNSVADLGVNGLANTVGQAYPNATTGVVNNTVYPATKVAANMLTRMLYDPRSDEDGEDRKLVFKDEEEEKKKEEKAAAASETEPDAPAKKSGTKKSGTPVSPGGTSTGHNPKTPGSTWVKSDTNPVFALANKMKPKTQQIQWNPYKANFSQQNRAAAE